VGRISSIGDGIATIYGLDGVKAGELIEFVGRSGAVVKGMALNLEKDSVGSVLFGSDSELAEGDLARRTNISVPVGLFLTGRVVDP
jgi:F-type H+-transporting ATPase subunit alpha